MADDEGPSEAAQAFQELRAEVTLMRRAVERLTAERMEVPEPPDYSETLGVIANNITATAQRVDMLVKSPMLAMTPEQLAGRITAAASTARQEDRQTIATARTGLEDVTRQLHSYVVSARRGDEQNRWLMWSAIGGIVVGMILWAVLAGIVARAVPASWQWPEKMAARSLDLPMWEGGQRLMRASAPEAFANIAAGDRIVTVNRQALEACQKRADKAREAVRCTVKIEPQAGR
ncbi:DUF6118 family protein [Novosphingobium cyanobacteriorum]|uniref:DUF6118 family protein n=1 Tax=Novosphingobium cyanobacteriorum TaxID=3024215 RepID=A0ABT6CQ17_9SPHN|nr:DUF6118 family protein [Novosphingobium cyanobacteriorum]MDF8335708.1 DUF6118 family protein [Novosphingobium cyanobacteriorum]